MTSQELQDLIKSELNIDGSPFETEFDTNMPLWWSFYTSSFPDEAIRSLYVKRRAIVFIIGKYRNYIKMTIGSDQIDGTGVIKNMQLLYNMVNDEIKQLDPNDSGIPFLESVDTVNKRDFPLEESCDFGSDWCPV